MADRLEYSSTRRSAWPRVIRHAIVAIVAIAGFAALMQVTVRVRVTHVDAVTGSTKTTTAWLGYFTSASTIVPSPLETRLRRAGPTIAYTPNWQFIGETGSSLLGIATYRACGSPAPALTNYRPLLDQFAAGATDEELRKYLQIMQSGTSQQQEKALRDIADRYLESATELHPR